jgi:rod shape-determining protein MreD
MRLENALVLVKTRVVIVTIFVAWVLSFISSPQTAWLDWVLLVLLFWRVYQPPRVSLTWAFAIGILVDLNQSSVLGEHALMYVCAIYAMGHLFHKIQYSSVLIHALSATGLVFAIQLLRAFLHLLFSSHSIDLQPMLWIALSAPAWLLLAWTLSRAARSNAVAIWITDK